VPVLKLANHIELHAEKVGLLLCPKAASNAILRAVSRTDTHYTRNLERIRRGYYRIGIVRNTWDRLVAVWASKCNPKWPAKLQHLRNSSFRTGMEFARFLEVVARNTGANHHYYPQHKIVGVCDEIWTTDELDDKWPARFPDLYLTHDNVNVLRERDWRPYYTPEMMEQVGETYADEIKHFGFEF